MVNTTQEFIDYIKGLEQQDLVALLLDLVYNGTVKEPAIKKILDRQVVK